MRLILVNKGEICKKVVLDTSPAEFLVLNKALKQFIKNENTNTDDLKIALEMDSTEIEYMEEGGNE